MKFALLACLLVAAGATALPQDVATASSDGRIVDIWFEDFIARLRNGIQERGLDPADIPYHKVDYVLIEGLVQLVGEVFDLRVVGASGIWVNYTSFNVLLGRFGFDVVVPYISVSVGKFDVEGRYGDRGGRIDLSGSLEIRNLRLTGHCLLRLDPGPRVTIYNINVNFSTDRIEADVKASWKCLACETPNDISEKMNLFINVLIADFLQTYKELIDTIIAEILRRIVNWWW